MDQSLPPPAPAAADARRRAATDRGDRRDKIGFPDPAASPLGTDAEAAGEPAARAAPPVESRPAARDRTGTAGGATAYEPPSVHDGPPRAAVWGLSLALVAASALAVAVAIWGLG